MCQDITPEGIPAQPLPQPELVRRLEWSQEMFDHFFNAKPVPPVVNDFWSQHALMDPELFGASK